MRKVKIISGVLILLFLFASCIRKYQDMDDKIVKDSQGNFYQLDYRIGAVFALKEINITEIDSLSKN